MRSESIVACGFSALVACSVPATHLSRLESSSTSSTSISSSGSSSTSGSGTGSTGSISSSGTSGSAATTSGTSNGSSSSGSGTTTGSSLCVPPVATSTGGERFSCELGDGGLFADPITIVTGVTYASSWHPVGVSDVNGDGNLDIVVTDQGSGDVVVLLGNGDGTFKPPVHSSVPAVDGGYSAVDGPVSFGPVSLTVAPLSQRATPSVVLADDYSMSLIVEGIQSDGTLSPIASLPIVDGGWSYALVADLNCDGIPDLVNSDATNQVTAFLGTGAGSYVQAGTVDQPGYSQCLGDFNEDGILDVIVGPTFFPPNFFDFSVFLGVGDGTFSDAGLNSEIAVGNDVWLIGDLNEDGHLDLLVYSGVGNGSNAVLLGRGDGTFEPGPQPTLSTYYTEVLQDLNGDGHLDYVGSTRNGFAVALGNGDGTFQSQIEFDPPADGIWQLVAGDLNNDGRPDLIVTDTNDTNVQIYLNNCR